MKHIEKHYEEEDAECDVEEEDDDGITTKPPALKTVLKNIMPFTDQRIHRYSGDKILIPDNLSNEQLANIVETAIKAKENYVKINHTFKYPVLEGAYALTQTIERRYGIVATKTLKGFMDMDIYSEVYNLRIDNSKSVMIVFGAVSLPNFDNKSYLKSSATITEEGEFVFHLGGLIKESFRNDVDEIIKDMHLYLEENSIYRNRAIKISFPPSDYDLDLWTPNQFAPEFFDLADIKESDLIVNENILNAMKACIWKPIENLNELKKMKISAKRGVLLEGKYGTGKTLCALITAKKAIENGWTFIYLKNPENFVNAIYFAKLYQPAIIFIEDIDHLVGGGRNDKINDILNTVDGIELKDSNIMYVFTTNNMHSITKAMVRPGRIDAIINMEAPDKSSASRLIEKYAGNLLSQEVNINKVAEVYAGVMPAMIRESVDRAKLIALDREDKTINENDLITSIQGLRRHIDLLEENQVETDQFRKNAEYFLEKVAGLIASKII